MSHRRTDTDPGGPPLAVDLLQRLGLPATASQEQIEDRHSRVLEFLRDAPAPLAGWSRRQSAEADEAYLLLTDPEVELAPGPRPEAAGESPPPPHTTTRDRDRNRDRDRDRDRDQDQDQDQDRDRDRRRGWLVRVAVIAAAAVVVVGVYALGRGPAVPGISGTPTDQPTAAASTTPLDQAKVAALMTKLQADPKDVASLRGLGDLYFQSGDYATASDWQRKILAIDGKDVTAHLALGAAQFNLGNSAEAERQWRQVLTLDPKHAEAHYDLGFLYLSQNPPDLAKVRAEWQAVVDLDPDSEIAKTVATHLASLDTPAPTQPTGK